MTGSEPLPPRGDTIFHGTVLVASAAVLIGAALLRPGAGSEIRWPFSEQSLPRLCAIQRWSGFSCPGCGLTRCFVRAIRGRWTSAARANAAGILVFAMVVFQIPYRALSIWRTRRRQPPPHVGRTATLFVWLLMAALIGQWLAGLVGLGSPW